MAMLGGYAKDVGEDPLGGRSRSGAVAAPGLAIDHGDLIPVSTP